MNLSNEMAAMVTGKRQQVVALLFATLLCGCSTVAPNAETSLKDAHPAENNGAATTASGAPNSVVSSTKLVGSSANTAGSAPSTAASSANTAANEHAGAVNAPSGKNALAAKDDGPPSPDGKEDVAAPASNAELQLAAVHIKQAWHRQLPVNSLTAFERQTYAEIYYRKLPKERLKSWDQFLALTAPAVAAPSRHRAISSSQMLPISLPGMPSSASPSGQ